MQLNWVDGNHSTELAIAMIKYNDFWYFRRHKSYLSREITQHPLAINRVFSFKLISLFVNTRGVNISFSQ